jgi:hypothetical protein
MNSDDTLAACDFRYFCHTLFMLKKENSRRKQAASEWWVGQPLNFPSKPAASDASVSRARKTKIRAKGKRK